MIKGRIAYITFLMIIFFLRVFFNNYGFSVLFIVCLIFPLFSLYTAKQVNKKTSIEIKVERNIVDKNIKIPVSIIFYNATIWTVLSCRLKYNISNKFYPNNEINYLYSALPGREKRVYGFEFYPLYCGNIDFRLDEIVVYDILKIFSFKKKIDICENITILPELASDENEMIYSIQRQAEEEILNRAGSNTDEVIDIRSYIPGDKLQKVHWKLTAKQDELMVKEYSEEIEYKAVLFVELYSDKENPEVLDNIIEASFSAASLLMKKFELYVCWYNKNSMEIEHNIIKQESDLIQTMMEIYHTPVYEEKELAYKTYKDYQTDNEYIFVYPFFDGEVKILWK